MHNSKDTRLIANIEEVCTGEVKTGGPDTILAASAIGSCIAVIAYNPAYKTGGIAHIMLPGAAKASQTNECLRYAENAIGELFRQMDLVEQGHSGLKIVIAGGANVLKKPDDNVCEMNIRSVTGILEEKGIVPAASSLGGVERRKVTLETASGVVKCAVGNGKDEILWRL
ncbi:MAG: hypothetical protein EPN22_06785 [Nitrospirae bacterium]|nr:MAG: hypothetical protein EPN22_06785 [Nitrospirota bacterium]